LLLERRHDAHDGVGGGAGRGRRGSLLALAVLAQLVAESARFVSYPYPLHILRLETILTAAVASGVLLTLHVANRYAPTRRRTLLIAAIAMMTLVTLLVPGFDGKTALVIVSALVVVIVAAAFGIRALCKRHLEVMGLRRDREFSLLVEGLSPRGRLPPGGLHTLLENALTHNSYPHGAVFRLERDTAPGGRIVYRLRSPLDAPRSASGRGQGHEYVRARLKEAFDDDWSFTSGPLGNEWIDTIEVPEAI